MLSDNSGGLVRGLIQPQHMNAVGGLHLILGTGNTITRGTYGWTRPPLLPAIPQPALDILKLGRSHQVVI